jgi:ariadne-1
MGDWNDHGANTGGYYKCNRYDSKGGPGGPEDQSDAAKAKRELDRYLHYYKRYHAHSEAQKFAKKQLKETEARMVLLQESSDDAKWSDVEFLKAANEQLVECRRVLKYTYVYAYYMDTGDAMQKERFEHHQEMLERFTENLSELSEKPLNEMDRTDVVNQTRVVDRFMKNILRYVDDGLND